MPPQTKPRAALGSALDRFEGRQNTEVNAHNAGRKTTFSFAGSATSLCIIAINVILMVLGFVVLGIGVKIHKNSTSGYLLGKIAIPAIITGAIMVALAILALLGTFLKRPGFLKIYVGVLGFLVLMQLIIGFVAVADEKHADQLIQLGWNKMDTTTKINVQTQWYCCGLGGIEDIIGNHTKTQPPTARVTPSPTASPIPGVTFAPSSAPTTAAPSAAPTSGAPTAPPTNSTVMIDPTCPPGATQPCLPRMKADLENNYKTAAAMLIVVAIIQLLGLIGGILLIKAIKKAKEDNRPAIVPSIFGSSG